MKIFDYFKNLTKKIEFYDTISKNDYLKVHMANPFAKPINLTVIWIENENNE